MSDPSFTTPYSIVFRETFFVTEVSNRGENLLHFGEEFLINRFGEPLCPLFDVFRIC